MKTFLIILGVVVILLFILLSLPLTIDLCFKKTLMLKIKYMGITLFNTEKKEKKKARKKQKKSTKSDTASKKDGFIKKIYDQKGFAGTIVYLCNIFCIIIKKLWWVIKHFEFEKFKLFISVATPSAADTAIKYGRVCAAVYPAISLLQTVSDFQIKQIDIVSDFDKTKPEFETSFLIKTQVFYLLVAAGGALSQFLKLQRKDREKYERKQS